MFGQTNSDYSNKYIEDTLLVKYVDIAFILNAPNQKEKSSTIWFLF